MSKDKQAIIPAGADMQRGRNVQKSRTPAERERDLAVIAKLYLQGKTHEFIAEVINENYPNNPLVVGSIRTDVYEIKQRWIKSTLVDFNEAKGQALAHWDQLASAYWEAWEASREEIVVTEDVFATDQVPMQGGSKVDIERTSQKRTIKKGEGDVRFLQGVERCVQNRCRILGVDKPNTFATDWREEAVAMGWDQSEIEKTFSVQVSYFLKAAMKAQGGEGQEIIDAKMVDLEE